MALAWIPKSILNKTNKICSNLLWTGKKEKIVIPWVKWDQIAKPKEMGGWGLKIPFTFVKALVEKSGWRLISTHSLWNKVITHKYIAPIPLLDWIKDSSFTTTPNSTIIWKAICNAFPLIHDGLVWKIGNGASVRIGADP